MANSTNEHKALLRNHLREIREEAAARDPDAAEKLADRFPQKLFDRFGPVVAGYAAINSELAPDHLISRLRGLGATIVLPRIETTGEMTFRRHDENALLVSGPLGLRQPPSDAEELRPGLVLAPLLGFDGRGARLGYGKGHYDKAMAALRDTGPCFYVGLAYDAQQVDAIPTERHDIPLDWVETPNMSVPLFLARAARQAEN